MKTNYIIVFVVYCLSLSHQFNISYKTVSQLLHGEEWGLDKMKTIFRLLLNPIFWIFNPIQIHQKYLIDSPNPNPIFKMYSIQIQIIFEKDVGQQILNGPV